MRFTNKEIMQIAMKQSAVDANCKVEDFCKKENVVVVSEKHAQARKYLQLPFECNLISYGNNIVASTKEEYREIVGLYINKYPVEHCFETPNMHVLNDEMQKQDLRICFMAEYFLPDVNHLHGVFGAALFFHWEYCVAGKNRAFATSLRTKPDVRSGRCGQIDSPALPRTGLSLCGDWHLYAGRPI